ncbi:hypothetical protein [Sorangium sp. So ce854]
MTVDRAGRRADLRIDIVTAGAGEAPLRTPAEVLTAAGPWA